jgi:hypothetical protein
LFISRRVLWRILIGQSLSVQCSVIGKKDVSLSVDFWRAQDLAIGISSVDFGVEVINRDASSILEDKVDHPGPRNRFVLEKK